MMTRGDGLSYAVGWVIPRNTVCDGVAPVRAEWQGGPLIRLSKRMWAGY